MTIVPPALREKLFCAGALTRAATRPDGRVVQIGDTDSGRLFKLTPTGRSEEGADGRGFCEETLDHRALVAGIGALPEARHTRCRGELSSASPNWIEFS